MARSAASPARAPKLRSWRVELFYKTKRENVLLRRTHDALNEGRAYMLAVERDIKPYRARTLVHVSIRPAAEG